MKLFVFLLGAAAGAYGMHYYYTVHPEEAPGARSAPLEHAREATNEKLEEWKLTGPDIKEELERTGKLVRRKATQAGDTLARAASNTRIVSVIKAKYTLDKDLSARSINVDCSEGNVTLTGSVQSPSHVSKAVAIALDTEGVTQVSSYLAVQAQHPAHDE